MKKRMQKHVLSFAATLMLILGGGLAVLIEFLINLTFQIHETLFWSFYPMVAGIVLGLMLIVIAICKPLRESLHRKFFL